ncbi:MAG: FitA-like ribbon-helix-helix domain-containing protein [Myxococcota bacterium]
MATLNVKSFPDDLYSELKARAAREHRSLAQEVVHLLDRAVREQERLSLLELRGLGREAWEGVDAAEHVRAERDSWD